MCTILPILAVYGIHSSQNVELSTVPEALDVSSGVLLLLYAALDPLSQSATEVTFKRNDLSASITRNCLMFGMVERRRRRVSVDQDLYRLI